MSWESYLIIKVAIEPRIHLLDRILYIRVDIEVNVNRIISCWPIYEHLLICRKCGNISLSHEVYIRDRTSWAFFMDDARACTGIDLVKYRLSGLKRSESALLPERIPWSRLLVIIGSKRKAWLSSGSIDHRNAYRILDYLCAYRDAVRIGGFCNRLSRQNRENTCGGVKRNPCWKRRNGGILTDRTSTVLILSRAVNQVWRSTCVRMVIFNYASRLALAYLGLPGHWIWDAEGGSGACVCSGGSLVSWPGGMGHIAQSHNTLAWSVSMFIGWVRIFIRYLLNIISERPTNVGLTLRLNQRRHDDRYGYNSQHIQCHF